MGNKKDAYGVVVIACLNFMQEALEYFLFISSNLSTFFAQFKNVKIMIRQ
jgi:hypothetical protein